MIMTITLILSFLVIINFLLLLFSCNKTTKKSTIERPKIIKQKTEVATKQLAHNQLAPTGS